MKKVRIIRNSQGDVVATHEVQEKGDFQIEIELEEDWEMEEVEAPDDYLSDPDAFMKSHKKSKKA